MANLRTNNLSGEQGQKAIKGSVVFGGGDNSSAGLTIADNSDLELGSETNWTIEFWLWLNGPTHGDYDVILGKGTASGGNSYEYFVEIMSDNTLDFFSTQAGNPWDFQQQISPVLSSDSWHHVAVVRNGSGSNSLKSYINGQEYGSFTAQSIHTGNSPFGIGYFAGGNNLFSKVTVSNLRIVKGTSVYTAAFTPPFEELTAIPNTVLLCCQDSDNPFKEETGKTISGVGHLDGGAVIHPRNNPPYGVDAGNTFGGPIQQSSQGYMYFPTGRTEERGRGRAVFMGGTQSPNTPKIMDTIDYVEMTTSGVGVRFGSLTTTCTQSAAFASSTRGINAGGSTSAPGDNQTNIIEFVTIATEGNGTDFGDLDTTHRRLGGSGHSSQTRGIITGGSGDSPGETNVIQFVTIASIGNATDFGDLLNPKDNMMSKNGSSTRMLICGGRDYTPSATVTNVIEFLTIATTGNSADFGDLTQARFAGTGCSSATRGVIVGGQTPTYVNTIDFVTIASAGNATDFGDLTDTTAFLGGASNSIIGIFAGGATPTKQSTIQSIEIATTGNAVAFGDNKVTNPVTSRGTCSDSHGGL